MSARHAEVAAILLAAGSSRRMDGEDKLWADLGGEPIVAHSLRALADLDEVDTVVVVAPSGRHEALLRIGERLGRALLCVEGGERRQDSVAAALHASPAAAWYLVHDAARPLATPALARRVLDAARRRLVAVPVVPVVDTLKHVDGDGRVLDTVDRSVLRAAQTPQGFDGPLLRRAHAHAAGEDATDDATLVERLGEPVWVIEGDPANVKVTTPGDLHLVRALLALRAGEGGGDGGR